MEKPVTLDFLFGLKAAGTEKVVEWCMEVGLLNKAYACPTCSKPMRMRSDKKTIDGYHWKCDGNSANPHSIKRSVRKGSWFSHSKLTLIDILLQTYFWVHELKQDFTSFILNVNRRTLTEWDSLCREICVHVCLLQNTAIGGPDKIVEIDATEFEKSKLHRGKGVEGRWVFGCLERETHRCFFKVVPNRSKATILEIIKQFILPGTTVISDCWRSFDCSTDEDFQQHALEYSIQFRDPIHDSQLLTEGTWSTIRRSLPFHTADGQFDSYLFEKIWRQTHPTRAGRFDYFLQCINSVYPPIIEEEKPAERIDPRKLL